MKSQNIHKNQSGAVTLLTALVLLIGITLVTLMSSKTVLVQIQIAADNYRMTQAVAAANAALDFGIGYFDGAVNAEVSLSLVLIMIITSVLIICLIL